MHHWHSGWRWFGHVEQAAYEIGYFLRKYGRVQVRQTKEKYGTARVYLSFGWDSVHSITHPGYVYNQYPQWLWKLQCRVNYSRLGRLFWTAVNKVVVPYHVFLYSLAYNRAFKKYPHIFLEIYSGADYHELIKLNKHSWYLYARALRKQNKKLYKNNTELEIKLEEYETRKESPLP